MYLCTNRNNINYREKAKIKSDIINSEKKKPYLIRDAQYFGALLCNQLLANKISYFLISRNQ